MVGPGLEICDAGAHSHFVQELVDRLLLLLRDVGVGRDEVRGAATFFVAADRGEDAPPSPADPEVPVPAKVLIIPALLTLRIL